jgi:hypothetical protein
VSASPSLSPRSDYNSSLRETFSGGKLTLLDKDKSTALTQSAFRNPDGEIVVVLANRGS